MVSATFASILRSGRSDFNDRFAAARRLYPDLQPEAFKSFLETHVDDFVSAVGRLDGDHAAEVATVAYDIALTLVGQKLAGPGARLSEVDEGWRRIFPRISSLLAVSSGRIIPAISNAIYQLASTPNARPKEWIELMERLGPECSDTDTLLKLGQVLAWRSGLAHFRNSAIATADSLPEQLTLEALDADSASNWASLRARLVDDPWFDPQSAKDSFDGIRVVGRIGAFRGFGGLFVVPPLVVSSGTHFLARSGNECWFLTADIFGATFHRASVSEFEAAAAQSSLPKSLTINGAAVLFNGARLELLDLGYFTSAAANSKTLALTSPLTHSIVLVALK